MINLIFDYDGTIHDCIKIYKPAFRKAQSYLQEIGLTLPATSADELERWLGFSASKMWASFAPTLPQEERRHCSKIIGDEMVRLIFAGKASLYLNAKETLACLKSQGYNLIFLSNCKRNYMQAHRKVFLLDRYFTAFYCGEDFGFAPKHEIFNVIRGHHCGEFIIIGDRYQDIEIALKYNLKSIGCTYGYGQSELIDASIKINYIEELCHILQTSCADPISAYTYKFG